MQPKGRKYRFWFGYAFIVILCAGILAILFYSKDDQPYQDLTHYSKVFGGRRTFRLYLPDSYKNSGKKYPVIYYFHGWGGRYFMDVNSMLAYKQIKDLVDKYQVILVMGDGSMDGKEPDPYNVGEPEDVKFSVQYKDYFPELFGYIDSSYRTLTDRAHRGIMGFSMGGFISLFMAGIYADKVCAVMSFAGSPELFVGYPGNETLYQMRYTFKNLEDISVRMHNGNSDILYYLNEEVLAGAVWSGKDIEYWSFQGGHMIDHSGRTSVFEKGMKFMTDAFGKTWPVPQIWSHYDLYSGFNLRGYEVTSDKKEPGFIFLKNVNKTGFGIYSNRWLPNGPAISPISIQVITAPVYSPGKPYDLILYSAARDKIVTMNKKADSNGRIQISLTTSDNQVGIVDKNSLPELVLLDYKVRDSSRYLGIENENRLSIRLMNRGGEHGISGPVRIILSTSDSSVHIKNPVSEILLAPGKRIVQPEAFTISCSKKPPPHAEPPEVRFLLTEYIGTKIFTDDFVVPVLFNVLDFDSMRIDDGVVIRDSAWGKGNGDGKADHGENILVYQGSHRLRLYTEDPYVIRDDERLAIEIIPARWPDGVSLSSVIRISGDCPDGHIITCIGSYETKTFNPIERKLTWGKIMIKVNAKK